jgi:molecular chaperone GrpE
MSRQDADDEDSPPDAAVDDSDEMDGQPAQEADRANPPADTEEDPEVAGDSLEEIAEEPDADVNEILDEITTPTGDNDADAAASADDLIEFAEQQPAETVAQAISTLRTERAELTDELEAERERADDLESRLSRKQADFQNYKKRQQKRMEEEKQRATEDLVERLLDVRDNLARALDQDEDADIRGGIESTLAQFDEELDRENVEVIEPELGTAVDPQRHEVLITVESDQPADTVAQLHRPGYEMAGKVLRPAQVAVSDGSGADEGKDDAETE